MRGIFLTTDLMFFSRVASLARENEWNLQCLSTADELLYRAEKETATLVLIDLTTRDLDLPKLLADLRALKTPPTTYIAFGPHVQKARLDSAREAGCDQVLTRGQFDANMAEILGRYLTEAQS